jgi:hypothetical protein
MVIVCIGTSAFWVNVAPLYLPSVSVPPAMVPNWKLSVPVPIAAVASATPTVAIFCFCASALTVMS